MNIILRHTLSKKVIATVILVLLISFIFSRLFSSETKKSQTSPKDSLPIPTDQIKTVPSDNQVACAQDVKQCPDGSYVSRRAPTCNFDLCPNELKNK